MDKRVVGIIYDFDNTLSPTNMQDVSYIPNLGMSSDEFWEQVDTMQKNIAMDKVLAYMYFMLKKASEKNILVTKEYLQQTGKDIKFFHGVSTWFERINKYAASLDITVKHYIISSGNMEIIEGSKIGKYFDIIYASKYMYNENGEAVWPALDINYTNKTQYVFRINKGRYDVTDDSINERVYTKAIPFSQLVYIGDGMTDVPCMSLVHERNGLSIAVYNNMQGQEVAATLLADDRVGYIAKADYSKDSYIEKLIMQKLTQVSKEM